MKINEYSLDLVDIQTIELPIGAQVLTVQVQDDIIFQDNIICLWAKVDETALLEPRNFAIYGIYKPLPENVGNYVATVQRNDSVWHVFEV